MVDRKIKLELDTSILRKEIAKTEAISDSDSKSSFMIQGLPKTKRNFDIQKCNCTRISTWKMMNKVIKWNFHNNSNMAFNSKHFQTLSRSWNVAFCQFFEEKKFQSSFRFLVLWINKEVWEAVLEMASALAIYFLITEVWLASAVQLSYSYSAISRET